LAIGRWLFAIAIGRWLLAVGYWPLAIAVGIVPDGSLSNAIFFYRGNTNCSFVDYLYIFIITFIIIMNRHLES